MSSAAGAADQRIDFSFRFWDVRTREWTQPTTLHRGGPAGLVGSLNSNDPTGWSSLVFTDFLPHMTAQERLAFYEQVPPRCSCGDEIKPGRDIFVRPTTEIAVLAESDGVIKSFSQHVVIHCAAPACHEESLRQIKRVHRTQKRAGYGIMKVCGACHRKSEHMNKCAACRVMHYCSVQCQRKDWPQHRKSCVPVPPVEPAQPAQPAAPQDRQQKEGKKAKGGNRQESRKDL